MSNSEFIASGKVEITPDFSKFRQQLRKGIQTDIKAILGSSNQQASKALRTAGQNLTKSANALERANKTLSRNLGTKNAESTKALTEQSKLLKQANRDLEQTLKEINRATVKTLKATTKELNAATKSLQSAIRALDRTATSRIREATEKTRVGAQAMKNAEKKLTGTVNSTLKANAKNMNQAATALGGAGRSVQRGFGGNLRTGLGSPQSNAGLGRTVQHFTTINKVTTTTTTKLLGLGSATAKLDSALLGLRTAIGSTAVIGLGAGALAAIALGKALRVLITDTVAFERNLNTFQEVAGATATEMDRVAATAKQLGADITLPNVSAGDAAETMLELAKAGLSVTDSIEGARGTLQLAAAANLDFAAATELAASAINAFGLAGRDAGTVADVLANAANLAQGSIADIGIALQQASAVGRQVGLSFQDTSTFLTILAQNGLKGSDAGTSLRTALIRLINPTKKAQEEIDRLGVNLRDAQGNLRVDVFQQFTNAMRGMSKEQRDQTLAMIGGQDALRAFAILGRQSTRVLSSLRTAMRNEGTAAEVAAARTRGLGGAAGALASTMQTIGISIGTKVAPGLTNFTNEVTAAINAVSESEGTIALLNTSLETLGAALHIVGQAAAFVGPLLLSIQGAFGGVVSAIGGQQIAVAAISFYALSKSLTLFARAQKAVLANFATALLLNRIGTAAATASAAMTLASGATGKLAVAFSLSRTGIAALATSLLGMINPVTAIVVGIAALAAGLVYVATRATATEQALSGIGKASDALADSLDRLATSQDAVSSSQRGVAQASLAAQRAALEERRARAALANTDAPKGSIERRQLEIEVATAIDNSRFASEDYTKATRDLVSAQDELSAAERARQDNVNDLISGQRVINTGLQAGFFSISEYVKGLREQAAEEQKSTSEAERGIGRRKQLLAELLSRADEVRKASTQEILGGGVSEQRLKVLEARLESVQRIAQIDVGVVLDPNRSTREIGRKLAEEFGGFGTMSAEEFMRFFERKLQSEASFKFAEAIRAPGEEGIRVAGEQGALTGKEFIAALELALRNGRALIADAMSELVRRATSRANTLTRENLELQVADASDAAILANLRETLAAEKVVLAGLEAERDSGELRGEALQKKKDAVREQLGVVSGLMDEIESLEKSMAAEVKKKADDIKQARIDANQAIVDAFGQRTDQAEAAIAAAGLTAGLKDDIKFNIVLRNILQKQRDAIRARIKDLIAKGKASVEELKVLRDFLAGLNTAIITVQGEIRSLFAEQQDKQKEALQRIIESAQLDVEFFNTTEQVNKEVAAKRRLIRALRRAQDLEKQGSNAWKEYRNQIEQTKKEIDELLKTKKDQNLSFQKLSFEFLQAQSGFAANLFGNLIPQGATAGLVGNASSAAAAFAGPTGAKKGALAGLDVAQATSAAAFAGPTGALKGATVGLGVSESASVAASIGKGPSSAQMATLISVARSIAEGIAKQNARMANPEAKKSRAREAASQDAVGNY